MTEWAEDALCASETFRQLAWAAGAERDPSQVFYPVSEDDEGSPFEPGQERDKRYELREARFERLARATCSACPVRLECLFSNMEMEQEAHGIVGGMSPESRLALLDSDEPEIVESVCQCGVVLYGAPGSVPEACSSNCKGKR